MSVQEQIQSVQIPVDPADHAKFCAWCEHFGLLTHFSVENSPYITVFYKLDNAANLYWLGANMMGDPVAASGSSPSLSVHKPRIAVCQACTNEKFGVKSRIAIAHTCGK